MQSNKVVITETSIDDSNTLSFLLKIANEDRSNNHIWNISNNSLAWEDLHSFYAYLNNDFGSYYLYIAYMGKTKVGVFGMLNIHDCVGSANIIIWIDQSVRKKTLLIKWWLLFLAKAQNKNVSYFYAKIKHSNAVSLDSSKRYGFTQCNQIPKHLTATNQDDKLVSCVVRNTQFNYFERKYINRYMADTIK